jgi:hypothetical protein
VVSRRLRSRSSFHDRPVAAKENAGILRFERAQAAIGRPIWITRRRPGKIFWIKTRLLKPVLETLQTLVREGDVDLLVRDRHDRVQHYMIAAARKADKLPIAAEILWNFLDGQVLDQDAEQSQSMSEIEFLAAPA